MADPKHFFMAMVPPTATQQEKKIGVRNGKPFTYPDEKWDKARDTLWAHLEPHRPAEPMTGGISMVTVWCFPKADGHEDGEPWTVKPDTDNLQKGLKDIMTRLGWWEDDALVADDRVVKIHSDVPGIRIDIEEIGK